MADIFNEIKEKYQDYCFKKDINFPKVSVIIPVFNTEDYIEKCLESVIKQTLKDIEIIVINDGSKDSSPQIINAFSDIDKRIKVITQENMGLSAARNKGLGFANGEYIAFMDSDDWVDNNYFEKLYEGAKRNNADIAISTIIRWRENYQKYRVHYVEEEVVSSLDEKIKICNIPKCCYVWNKLYRADILKQNNFVEGIYYEDMIWTPEIIKKSDKLVTVPDINYYYRANKSSIVKKVQSPKKQQDYYNSKKSVIKFFKDNNLKLNKKYKNITKKQKYLFGIPIIKVKEFEDTETTILFGFLKIFKKPVQKTFVVFNTAHFGDSLVCNSLIQNIKQIYPNSKVVFVCDKKYYDVAKYQKDVDDVVIYDKKGENKGFKGLIKFVKNFPYKKPFATFITYPNIRNCFVATLLGSRKIIQGKGFLKSKLPTQIQHANLLKKITKQEIKNLPIEYIISDEIPETLKNEIHKGEKYIGLCSLTKNQPKDIPLQTSMDLIKKFNEEGKYKIIFFGTGEENKAYAESLRKAGCRFINLVNETTISEMAQVLKNCKALITADTGTMHLGYAVKTPVLAVFYEKITLSQWSPQPDLYKAITIASNQTSENIYKLSKILINEDANKKLSVVIPTLQKNKDLLINLLKILEKDDVVDEIILIDNSGKGLDYNNSKLRIVIPKENMYVNPAWNFGVRESKNNIVALLNDDITIAPDFCSKVVSKMNPKMGCVGASLNYIKESENIKYSITSSDLKLKPIKNITYHWGISIFFYKSSYIEIPEEMKIYRGDDWIFYQNKDIHRQNYFIEGQEIYHYGSLSSKSEKLKPIQKRDRSFYRKYTKKWYQHYFDLEELSDGYRITFFCFKIIVHSKKKNF